MLKGFLDLFSAKDLFEKLSSDYEAFCADPKDSYKAFNFFVTAEHIPDWIGNVGIKYNEPYLRINSHLATGAKHFEVKNKDKKSVEGFSVDVYVEDGYVEDGYIETVLVVNLTDEEAELIGMETIELNKLAKNVFEYWEKYFEENSVI